MLNLKVKLLIDYHEEFLKSPASRVLCADHCEDLLSIWRDPEIYEFYEPDEWPTKKEIWAAMPELNELGYFLVDKKIIHQPERLREKATTAKV